MKKNENIKQKDDLKIIKERITKDIELFKKKAKSVEDKIKNYIDKNPEKSILIATGIGATIGALIGLGFKKKK
jgi:ElaB/YqjD/DUF883 family membrane-anchored ribosome-binding protein